MSHKIGFPSFILFLAFAFALCSTIMYVGQAEARETSLEYVGEVMASSDGGVFLVSDSGERLKITSNPMPLFDDSIIEAKMGSAVISLAPDGLVEVMKASEIKIDRYGVRNFIALNSGTIKFSVPSKELLSIAIPSEGISITMGSKLASTSDKIVIDSSARAGLVELREDGSAVVSSLKGSLEVSTVEGKTMVLEEGKSMMVARANVSTSRTKSVAAASRTHDMIMLAATVGVGASVAIIANNINAGGWVASSP